MRLLPPAGTHPAGLDSVLPAQWEHAPAGAAVNALQVLENEQVLEGLGSLQIQCLGSLTVSIAGLPGGIPGFSFHLFCVT